MKTRHIPVLLQEVVRSLDLDKGGVFLDGTFGGGGHSKEVRKRYPLVHIIGLDQDPRASKQGREEGFEVFTQNFSNLDLVLDEIGVDKVDAILLDLGISSDQLSEEGRGFSFERDEPLDMRMSNEGISAKEVVNTFDENALELILRGFGEERYSRQIAKAIVEAREVKPIETTGDLVKIVESVKKSSWREKIHPATLTFQALRIAVNQELQALEEGLGKALERLEKGGVLAVISFHSLEDRIVKHFFRQMKEEGRGEILTKRPITASEEEERANPRSRSAKLRIFKINDK